VWLISTDNQLLYRAGTVGDSGTLGTHWVAVPLPTEAGNLFSVSSGKHVVAITDNVGRVWLRTRVGLGPLFNPGGLSWLRMNGLLKQVEVYETESVLAMWGVGMGNGAVYVKFLSPGRNYTAIN
jgi:hypothetical protein